MFSTKECAWAQVAMKLFGATITGLRGFEFKRGIEKELIYAAGDEAIDITSGNKKAEGSLALLSYEVHRLNDAAQMAGYDSILEVPHNLILVTCAFKVNPTTPIRILETPLGIAFTEETYGLKQNDKFMEVQLPFISQRITARKGQ